MLAMVQRGPRRDDVAPMGLRPALPQLRDACRRPAPLPAPRQPRATPCSLAPLGSRLTPEQPSRNPQLGVLGDLFVQRLRFARRTASAAEFEDAHDPDDAPVGKGQHVARPHPVMRFGDDRLIDPEPALGDQLGRQRPGLEEAGLPQPFVEPEALGRRVRQRSSGDADPTQGSERRGQRAGGRPCARRRRWRSARRGGSAPRRRGCSPAPRPPGRARPGKAGQAQQLQVQIKRRRAGQRPQARRQALDHVDAHARVRKHLVAGRLGSLLRGDGSGGKGRAGQRVTSPPRGAGCPTAWHAGATAGACNIAAR